MSRYSDDGDYDEDFNNQGEFWRANSQRALKGKRGRQALADLREALLNLPEKRLIERALCTVNPEKRTAGVGKWSDVPQIIEEQGEGVCAVGAYAWWKKVKAGADPQQAFEELPTLDDSNHGIWDTEQFGMQAGLTQYVAFEMAYRNDETYEGVTPEERYTKFLAWLDSELGERDVVEQLAGQMGGAS